MLSAAALVLLAVLSLFIADSIRTYAGLKQFGGHWSAGWSRIWLLKANASGRMNKVFTTINDEYGSTARIGPKMLITTDPVLFRRMNAVRSSFTRGPWYSALRLHPERDNITSHVDEGIHANLRNKMSPGYSGKENSHMEDDVDQNLLRYLELIRGKYVSRVDDLKTVDLSCITSFFTLDVISKIAFGQTFGFLDRDDDPFGYIANLKEYLPAIIVFGVFTELQKILKAPILKSLLPKSTDKRGLGAVMGFAKDRVDERFGPKPLVRKDMLGSFIRRGMSQEELESETLTQITAGSDSTASSLRITLHFISTTPTVLDKLLAEARSAIAAGRISRPVIKDSEARQLPYLQACIKEGLRMYPPVTGLLAKMVPEDGVHIDVDGEDKFAPAGTQIGWNSWGMMRHTGIFGADSEIFRPERWLPRDYSEKEKARVQEMTETVTLVFGYGRFGCLGRGVAIMELNKAILETLLRFNLQPVSLSHPFDEKVIGFYIHDNMNFVVTERQDDAKKGADGQTMNGGPAMEVAALPGAYDD